MGPVSNIMFVRLYHDQFVSLNEFTAKLNNVRCYITAHEQCKVLFTLFIVSLNVSDMTAVIRYEISRMVTRKFPFHLRGSSTAFISK